MRRVLGSCELRALRVCATISRRRSLRPENAGKMLTRARSTGKLRLMLLAGIWRLSFSNLYVVYYSGCRPCQNFSIMDYPDYIILCINMDGLCIPSYPGRRLGSPTVDVRIAYHVYKRRDRQHNWAYLGYTHGPRKCSAKPVDRSLHSWEGWHVLKAHQILPPPVMCIHMYRRGSLLEKLGSTKTRPCSPLPPRTPKSIHHKTRAKTNIK